MAICRTAHADPVTEPSQTAPAAPTDIPDEARQRLDEAYRHKAEHELDGARAAFLAARQAGANAQVVALELGYLAAEQGDFAAARTAFGEAMKGADPELVREAQRELADIEERQASGPAESPAVTKVASPAQQAAATSLLDAAYRYKKNHDLAAAAAAFRAAERAGADPQLVAMELGYLASSQDDAVGARAAFTRATQGSDRALALQAQRELDAATSGESEGHRALWADLYAEAFGWKRFVGADQDTDLVPTLRLRAYWTPFSKVDVHAYVFAQATRDLASRGPSGNGGLPLIYADNTALVGPGVLVRFWSSRVGVFAQLGPAFELVDSRRGVRLDARVGAHLGLESQGCWPAAISSATLRAAWCSDLYAEATYVNRYANDVIGFARGRVGFSYAITGPVEWEAAAELRVALDVNGDYYNNFADIGIGPRWRLLTPFRLDLLLGPHIGSYFGRSNIDPAPQELRYLDLRAQAATYVEF